MSWKSWTSSHEVAQRDLMCHYSVPNKRTVLWGTSPPFWWVPYIAFCWAVYWNMLPHENILCVGRFLQLLWYQASALPLERVWGKKSDLVNFFFSCQGTQIPIPPCKSFTSVCHMRMAGSYHGSSLVLDHPHDSGHICGRLVGTFLATNISLVQCMVWALHACMQ